MLVCYWTFYKDTKKSPVDETLFWRSGGTDSLPRPSYEICFALFGSPAGGGYIFVGDSMSEIQRCIVPAKFETTRRQERKRGSHTASVQTI